MPITTNEKKALNILKRTLSRDFSPIEFRLYGSKAKGTDSEESDLDLMIVLENLTPEIESQIDDLIFKLNIKYDCLIAALYFSRNELEVGPLAESPIYRHIQQEGMRL
jgi:predicted nucleotidyltransferase